MKKHWSFVVCDPRILYPTALLLLGGGIAAALICRDPSQFTRVGNFIIGTGVWMSLRFTLREGINKHKNLADTLPTVPGTGQLNSSFFNNITFSIGDARLQLHGFALVIAGSIVGSYGDVILRFLLPQHFPVPMCA